MPGTSQRRARSWPTNCCFGGEDFQTLYVTSSDVGQLLALRWDVPGMRLHPDR